MVGYLHLWLFVVMYPVILTLVDGASSENLIAFKNSLHDSSLLESWIPGKDACNFYGVHCPPGKVLVSSIDLSGIPLSTSAHLVASYLLSMKTVERVSLRRCNISGPIVFPSGSKCSSVLTHLDLSQNMLSDSVFNLAGLQSCSALTSLNVSSNSLVFDGGKRNSDIGLSYESIDLSFNSIDGVDVVPFLLSTGCSNLRTLSLRGNEVSGVLDFSTCGNLQYLDISSNNFSSAVPFFGECSALRHLDISGNRFSRYLGRAIAPCEKLAFFNASLNQFAGKVPAVPTGSLQVLSLGGNQFEGGIPVQGLNACPVLLVLDLSRNNFSGVLPNELSKCNSLRVFDLSHNNFVGDLPVNLLLAMDSLRVLDLSFNAFTGSIPESFSNLAHLETLDLSANEFSGGLPPGICRNLKSLFLQDNRLTGELPPSIGNCSQLTDLHLSFNFLKGTVPSSLGSLSLLRDLKLWFNMFEGEIPTELTRLKNLEALIMDFNYLTGSIPSGLSNCTNLNWVSLSNNKLSGVIPPSLGLLPNLTILKLSNNSISGAIPRELGDCKSLIWLDLNSNNLSGSIPPELFKQSGNIAVNFIRGKRYVFLRNRRNEECHGTGNLLEFEGIKDDELNMMSSRLPCSFDRVYGGHTQPTFNNNGSMMFLDLSWNGLSGEIPKEIGSMLYLYIMNLGHNNITGKIPGELGFLKGLNILDLSFNKIGGAIPQSMTGLSLLTDIDLSNNNLTGMIPEGGQFETFMATSFLNNSGLCGIPLLTCGRGERSDTTSNRKSRGSPAALAGSIAVGIVFFIACIMGMIYVVFEGKKRKRTKNVPMDVYMDGNSHSVIDINSAAWKTISTKEALSISLVAFEKPLRKLNFADLLDATNGFHNDSLVGSGGFGDVYKARLKDGTTVAIKKLKQVSGQGDREFTAEMDTLGKIKHRNLVPLLGYCKVGEERLLVYEYMKYGSLEDVLHDETKQGVKLDWAARRNIALGAARGLAFLHHNCIPLIIHRDMKSSNVLLDDNMESRVSDFGMARQMSAVDTHLSVSTLAGTPGYVPPEYYQSFRCSTRGDVYSYGVVLLELLTGRRPTDASEFGDNNLVGWVKQHAKLKITDVFDRTLMEDDPSLEIELLQHLKVACACLDDRPWRRPTMIQVMAMFKEIQTGSDVDSHSVSISEMSIDEAG